MDIPCFEDWAKDLWALLHTCVHVWCVHVHHTMEILSLSSLSQVYRQWTLHVHPLLICGTKISGHINNLWGTENSAKSGQLVAMHMWVHIVNIMQWLWDQWRWSYHDSNINCSWHRWLNSVCMQCQARPCVVETHSLQTPISRRSDVWHEGITLKLGTCHAPLITSRV